MRSSVVGAWLRGKVFLRGDGSFQGKYRLLIERGWRNKRLRARDLTEAEREFQRFLETLLPPKCDPIAAAMPPKTPPRTVGEFMTHHLATLKIVGQPSWRQYECRWRLHTAAHFAHLTFRELTPSVVQAWSLQLRTRGASSGRDRNLSPRWQLGIVNAFSSCLSQAVTLGYLERNPCRAARRFLPREDELDMESQDESDRKVRCLSAPQIRILFASQKLLPCELAEYVFAFFSLCRIGEVRALLWSDLSLDGPHPYARISKQWTGALPKGHRRREIPIHPECAAMLRIWHARGWQHHVGRAPKASDLIFPNKRGTLWRGHAEDRLRSALQKTGLPRITYHGLRHSGATAYRDAGLCVEDIEALLGHAPRERRITIHYARATLPQLSREVGKLRLFAPGGSSAVDSSGGGSARVGDMTVKPSTAKARETAERASSETFSPSPTEHPRKNAPIVGAAHTPGDLSSSIPGFMASLLEARRDELLPSQATPRPAAASLAQHGAARGLPFDGLSPAELRQIRRGMRPSRARDAVDAFLAANALGEQANPRPGTVRKAGERYQWTGNGKVWRDSREQRFQCFACFAHEPIDSAEKLAAFQDAHRITGELCAAEDQKRKVRA